MKESVDKVKTFIRSMLKKGMRPEKIAMGVALGGTLGVFPIPGVSTALCAVAAVGLRLNHVVIQTINYAVYPFQILLLGGYIALGNYLFGKNGSSEAFNSMVNLMQADLWQGLLAIKDLALSAAMVWLITSPLLAVSVYYLARFVANRLQKALRKSEMGATEPGQNKESASRLRRQNRPSEMPDEQWKNSRGLDCVTCHA